MIKVKAIQDFELKDFEKISNIQRAGGRNKEGWLYTGDKFECDEDMVKYLTGGNELGKTVVKVIEVEPKIEDEENIIPLEDKETLDKIGKDILKHVKPKKKSKK